MIRACLITLVLTVLALPIGGATAAEPLDLRMRSREQIAPDSDRYRAVTKKVSWNPQETAIVICDMWNDHYCRKAARRVAEMAPRMNDVLTAARKQGVLIIHSPSGCMKQYEGMPQRKLAQQAPKISTKTPLKGWCYLDEKHEAKMPVEVDQPSDDDGTIREAVRFFDRQIETLQIAKEDAIADGPDAFYLMKQRGIKNVIIMGVHTNMCVLGRPFGIRQMVYQGQNVALMRDMTDCMYNPRNKPYVNHYTGNDLVFGHIERYWCPTITSADILGGQPFRFPGDNRKHLVVVMAEDEYETERTLPPFCLKHFGAHFKISYVYGNAENRNDIPGVELLNDADIAIWSIRRRPLPAAQMKAFRKYLADGKPLVAIRTASHAFSQRSVKPESGLHQWPEFDREVLGGDYSGHFPNDDKTMVRAIAEAADHPILRGVPKEDFRVFGSLYKNENILTTAAPLMVGHIEGSDELHPVAWTHQRPNRGRVFYTSLGHPKTFEVEAFQHLLHNATYWAANLPVPSMPH